MRTVSRMMLGMLAMITWAEAGTSKTFHVSPNGCDTASGSWWRPFATFERAQQAVAEFKARHPAEAIERIEVRFRGGTYPLKQPIRIRPEHGGTATIPVIYRSSGDAPPVFTGGRLITGWTVRADGAWTTHLPEVKSGSWDFAQLFVNGARRFRPRIPRKGYFTTTNDFETVEAGVNGFYYKEDGLDPAWSNLQDIEFHTLHIWSASRVRLKSIDASRKIVRFLKTRNYNQYWGSYKGPGWGENGCRFWAENVKEAFGVPGEWYLDRPTGTLSYMPMPGERPDTARVEVPILPLLLIVEGDADRPSTRGLRGWFSNRRAGPPPSPEISSPKPRSTSPRPQSSSMPGTSQSAVACSPNSPVTPSPSARALTPTRSMPASCPTSARAA